MNGGYYATTRLYMVCQRKTCSGRKSQSDRDLRQKGCVSEHKTTQTHNGTPQSTTDTESAKLRGNAPQ